MLVAGARGTERRILSTRALVGIGVAMAVVLVPLWGEISARLTGPDGGSAESRRPLYALAWRMIVDHPLTGVGANNFVAALPHYAGPAFTGDWLYVVHDRYLLIWSQSGLGALILFLVFLATTIRRGWRARLSEDALLSAAGLGLAAGVVSMAVHMHVDILNSRAANQTLFLAAGVLAAPVMAQAARRRAGVGRGR